MGEGEERGRGREAAINGIVCLPVVASVFVPSLSKVFHSWGSRSSCPREGEMERERRREREAKKKEELLRALSSKNCAECHCSIVMSK